MSERDRDMDEELREHVARLTEQNLAAGMSDTEARRAALLRFGSAEVVKETARAQRPLAWLADLGRDLAYAARMLRVHPGFTVVVVLTLALGIGTNATIFSLVNAVFWKPLPIKDPEGLVLFSEGSGGGLRDGRIRGRVDFYARALYQQLRDGDRSFAGIAAQASGQRTAIVGWNRPIEAGSDDLALGREVSANYFDVLGVSAHIGRGFLAEDETTPGANPVVVLSHAYWQRRFGGDPAVLGGQLTVNQTRYTVVGVTAPGFTGTAVGGATDFWIPMTMVADPSWLSTRKHRWLFLLGRLKPGTSMASAEASVNVVLQHYLGEEQASTRQQAEYRKAYIQLESGATGVGSLRRTFREPLRALMTGVGLLLLVVCLNVSHLLLARTLGRRREMTIRTALGASRRRLMRQLFTEGLLLSTLAAVAGAFAASWLGQVLVAPAPARGLPPTLDVGADIRVVAFIALLALATTVMVSLVPALQASRLDLQTDLHATAPALAGGASRRLASRLLLVSQVAFSLVLLVSSGLLARSLNRLREVDKGFDDNNLLQVDMFAHLPDLGAAQTAALGEQLLSRVSALPGVHAASQSRMPLLTGSQWTEDAGLPGKPDRQEIHLEAISPSYFETVGMKLVRGRGFTDQDRLTSPKVAVINETLARRFFGGAAGALGQRISTPDHEVEVVGVLADARPVYLRWEPRPFLYYPLAQSPRFLTSLQVRAHEQTRDLAPLAESLRGAVRQTHPGLRVVTIRTVREQAEQSLNQERLLAILATAFGTAALFLVCVGLYGVISQLAGQRTSEIGVRIALGATTGGVRWMVLRQSFLLVLAGVAVGLPAALAAARLLGTFLFGVSPQDPPTFLAAGLALLAVAALAGYLPARRASRLDPMQALRHE